MQTIAFDPERHAYVVDGAEVPSVTQVLRNAGVVDARFFTASAAERGSAVHAAVEYDVAGDLDEASVDDVVAPYLAAWRRFRSMSGFRPLPGLCERPMYCARWHFAGRPDLVGRMNGRNVLVDVKTGTASWAHLQTAAYSMLDDVAPLFPARFALRLSADGAFRLVPFRDTGDATRFLAALSRWRFTK